LYKLTTNLAAGELGSVQIQVDQWNGAQQRHWQVDSESLAQAVAKAAREGTAGAAKMDKDATVDTVSCSQVQMSSANVARQSPWGGNVD
jgi:hypothetical protein